MKKLFYILIFFCFVFNLNAQINLVPNGGFEQLDSCGFNGFTNGSNLYLATGWSSSHNTPDLFSNCVNSNGNFKTPNNMFGYQTPYIGNNYAGFFNYIYSNYLYTEHLCSQLTQTLIPATQYFFSAKVSRADSLNCATNKFGVFFRKNLQYQNLLDPQINQSHITFNDTINNSGNWVKISGSFVADSAYKYIYLGNFYDKQNVDTLVNNFPNKQSLQPTGGNYDYRCISYYYIDDIKLSTDSIFVATGLNENKKLANDQFIYPNPASNYVYIKENVDIIKVVLYDHLGNVLKIKNVNELLIDLTDLSEGIYFVKITYKNNNQTINKLIKTQ